MRIIKAKDIAGMAQAAVNALTQQIGKTLEEKELCVLAVPGGRSVVPIFALLADERRIPWKKVHVFIVDERLVPLTDPESNGKLVREGFVDALIKAGQMQEGNFHPFIYRPEAKDKGADVYWKELQRFGGAYDVILLSSGEDGHVGGLYPGHHSVKDDAEGYIWMSDSPKPPPQRMSSSRRLMLRSSRGVLLFMGEAKRDSFKRFLDPSVEVPACPAKIASMLPEAVVITDLH